MEFVPLLAGINWLAPFSPIISALGALLGGIDNVTHNIGWSLVLLAALIAAGLWPLRQQQFKSAAAMQKLAPEIKALQARFKGDPTRLNTETMALYKERGVNPLASCLPLLIQMPILISVYQAINGNKGRFNEAGFLWIGTPISHALPFLATSLTNPDYVLLALYIVSMYFSFKLAAPPTDPSQAQQQQIMAFISPVMIGYFAFQNKWPSALIVYWLSSNLFTMGQQFLGARARTANDRKAAAAALLNPQSAPELTGKAAKRLRPPGTALPAAGLKAATGAGAANGKSMQSGGAKNGGGATKNGAAKPGTGTNAAAKRRR